MPLTIQRTAKVYLLWDEADRIALFQDHSAAGWLPNLTIVDGVFVVSLQKSATRQLIQAPTSSVIVSDLVSVEAMTVEAFNAVHPDDAIEEPGS